MQTLYAVFQAEVASKTEQRQLLKQSIDNFYGLYLSLHTLPTALLQMAERLLKISKTRYLSDGSEITPEKLATNGFLQYLSKSAYNPKVLKSHQAINWDIESKRLRLIYDDILQSDLYKSALSSSDSADFESDKNFFMDIYEDLIAPSDTLLDCLEAHQLTWVSDYPFANTLIVKEWRAAGYPTLFPRALPPLFKEKTDEDFVYNLLEKTIEESDKYDLLIGQKTINWDAKRIAKLDVILLKMALCEALYADEIPIRVTINEYIELAKDYATPKSNIFINGILDKILKELSENNSLKKNIEV